MTTDMSAAPEIARLAEPILLVPAPPPGPPHGPAVRGSAATAAAQVTLGALAGRLRSLAATPERWCGLVRFDPDRSVKIMIEESASYQAWLVILPPGDAGQGCDCHAVTMIAGEATEGTPESAVLRPGPVRVHGQHHGRHRGKHGQRHGLRGRGADYSISLHARVHRPA
ncbi:MAG TPA: hypothetical protein VEH31_32270 [Streptosporangiaceae bacterium]|nr:hypothetical protein [Streptosporangiaceae bacterium]